MIVKYIFWNSGILLKVIYIKKSNIFVLVFFHLTFEMFIWQTIEIYWHYDIKFLVKNLSWLSITYFSVSLLLFSSLGNYWGRWQISILSQNIPKSNFQDPSIYYSIQNCQACSPSLHSAAVRMMNRKASVLGPQANLSLYSLVFSLWKV